MHQVPTWPPRTIAGNLHLPSRDCHLVTPSPVAYANAVHDEFQWDEPQETPTSTNRLSLAIKKSKTPTVKSISTPFQSPMGYSGDTWPPLASRDSPLTSTPQDLKDTDPLYLTTSLVSVSTHVKSYCRQCDGPSFVVDVYCPTASGHTSCRQQRLSSSLLTRFSLLWDIRGLFRMVRFHLC